MRDLDLFAFGREQHGMISNDVAGAHGVKADLSPRPLAGDAHTPVGGDGLQPLPAAARRSLAKP